MDNQHAGLSQSPAEPHIAALYEQATHRRPCRATNPPRRRRAASSRRWWQLLTRRLSRAS